MGQNRSRKRGSRYLKRIRGIKLRRRELRKESGYRGEISLGKWNRAANPEVRKLRFEKAMTSELRIRMTLNRLMKEVKCGISGKLWD